jgi:hypothetical protein
MFTAFVAVSFRLGAQCDDLLRDLHLLSWSRSGGSVQFWSDIKSEPPPRFQELAKKFNPEFVNGLPTFESRPDHYGISDWVKAFARAHPLHAQFIREAKYQLKISQKAFAEHQQKMEFDPAGVEVANLELAFRSQYYSEMRSALSGDFLPFPDQGSEGVDSFFERRAKGGYFDLYEAHVRLYHHETDLIGLLQQDRPNPEELTKTREAIRFYQQLIARLPPVSEFRGGSLR